MLKEGKAMMTQEFSIKDLENFSGVKAHTIRIWEQRYGILRPDRTDTNIRKYSDRDLKVLLNISLLNSLGYKISAIAKMSDDKIREVINKHATDQQGQEHYSHILKLAMLNYDDDLFSNVFDPYVEQHGLELTFRQILMPFLQHIGMLWQSDAICPAQEHFVSALIRQKLLAHIENVKTPIDRTKRALVLYLPELEIHELSLLMLQYIFKLRGFKTIMLGSSVPADDLKQVYQRLGAVDFVSIFTTHPSTVLIPDYLKRLIRLLQDTDCHFHFTGYNIQGIKSPDSLYVSIYPNVDTLLQNF
jgi:MerR family transcriptional regulator, light-induced transcriptional regulator